MSKINKVTRIQCPNCKKDDNNVWMVSFRDPLSLDDRLNDAHQLRCCDCGSQGAARQTTSAACDVWTVADEPKEKELEKCLACNEIPQVDSTKTHKVACFNCNYSAIDVPSWNAYCRKIKEKMK